MIEKRVIKLGHVVFVYSQPPEEALIGVVDSIDYPIVTVDVIPKSSNIFGKKEKIDISKNIPLTILTDDDIKEYLTPKERKCLKKVQEDSDIVDLFSGTY